MNADRPTEYLIRTPDGRDYGRHRDFDQCSQTADFLGRGAVVVPLDDFLLPVRDSRTGRERIDYTAR